MTFPIRIKALVLSVALGLIVPGVPTAVAGWGYDDDETAAAKTPQPAAPPMLRASAVVDGKLVRLGDLFDNSGEQADVAVAYAPEPGERAVFDANWLFRLARAYKLDWRPSSPLDQVVVERDSISLDRGEIEDAILAALADQAAEPTMDDMEVELSNRALLIHVPAGAGTRIAVEDVAYQPTTKRFTAQVVAPAGDPAAQRVRVRGRLVRMVDVPVPARRVLKGEVIGPHDLQWIRVQADRLQHDVAVNADTLIGMAPRQGLRAGRPVRVSEVSKPVLVPKNGIVTLVLKHPYMTLTAQGRALENGSDGETIRVSNSQSRNVVEAVVIGTNLVQVVANDFALTN